MTKPQYSTFTTDLSVRPDDIDMNNHVHNSRYLDFVLAARYDQMSRCYHMSMDEFVALGLTWVVTQCSIEFKRPLLLGDVMTVTTGIEEVGGSVARVKFLIHKKGSGKLCAEGFFEYAMIDAKSGKRAPIPDEAVRKYSV